MFDNTINTLTRSLDYSAEKNRAISNNIANVDTPGYKARQVSFKNVLSETMNSSFTTKKTRPQHVDFSKTPNNLGMTTKKGEIYNHNGNNVDIDKEMAELAKNQIYQQALVDRLNGKFGDLQAVLRGVS